jgi:shikimate 5-dehydrogenase
MAENGRTAQRNLLLGLIGAPIKHSASPAMHEAAAAALGFRAYYHLIEVADADREGLRLMLQGVRRLGFAGVNVTYPYKEAVVPLLDELSPAAAAIGAVNTIVVRAGRLVGYNDRARACDLPSHGCLRTLFRHEAVARGDERGLRCGYGTARGAAAGGVNGGRSRTVRGGGSLKGGQSR